MGFAQEFLSYSPDRVINRISPPPLACASILHFFAAEECLPPRSDKEKGEREKVLEKNTRAKLGAKIGSRQRINTTTIKSTVDAITETYFV